MSFLLINERLLLILHGPPDRHFDILDLLPQIKTRIGGGGGFGLASTSWHKILKRQGFISLPTGDLLCSHACEKPRQRMAG